ncbi:MAG: hypothetical protein ABSE62_11020 [Chthoniobacteraceae bacterium]
MHSLPKNFEFSRPLKERPWFRGAVIAAVLLIFGAVKLPIEVRLNEDYRDAFFHGAKLNLSLRQRIGQIGFLAALGGFRALVADGLWIQAHIDWTQTAWGKMLFIFNNVTALQPRNIMFWDMSAWHMAYNASAAALQDTTQPRMALRLKHQHEYFLIGKDLLERGIANNPDRYKLYESLGNIERDKLMDHCAAAVQFAKAAQFSDAPDYERRFAAYELSYCPGHERESYEKLLALYKIGEKEWLPTLLSRLKILQEQLNIPEARRIKIPEKDLPPHH